MKVMLISLLLTQAPAENLPKQDCAGSAQEKARLAESSTQQKQAHEKAVQGLLKLGVLPAEKVNKEQNKSAEAWTDKTSAMGSCQ